MSGSRLDLVDGHTRAAHGIISGEDRVFKFVRREAANQGANAGGIALEGVIDCLIPRFALQPGGFARVRNREFGIDAGPHGIFM